MLFSLFENWSQTSFVKKLCPFLKWLVFFIRFLLKNYVLFGFHCEFVFYFVCEWIFLLLNNCVLVAVAWKKHESFSCPFVNNWLSYLQIPLTNCDSYSLVLWYYVNYYKAREYKALMIYWTLKRQPFFYGFLYRFLLHERLLSESRLCIFGYSRGFFYKTLTLLCCISYSGMLRDFEGCWDGMGWGGIFLGLVSFGGVVSSRWIICQIYLPSYFLLSQIFLQILSVLVFTFAASVFIKHSFYFKVAFVSATHTSILFKHVCSKSHPIYDCW